LERFGLESLEKLPPLAFEVVASIEDGPVLEPAEDDGADPARSLEGVTGPHGG
jgi:hypothetical protein